MSDVVKIEPAQQLEALNNKIKALSDGQNIVLQSDIAYGELTLKVEAVHLLELLQSLKNDPDFHFVQLIDLCGVDYPDRQRRFEVVYHLMSYEKNIRLRVKIETDAETPVPSVTEIYPCANWFEREAFDMYGIFFSNHSDLRRILTDYGFSGYPLRKDFPMTGHVEVRWDDAEKRVIYEPVHLNQEYRFFDFLSPWEGDGLAHPLKNQKTGV